MSDLQKHARLEGSGVALFPASGLGTRLGLGACSPRKLLEIRCSEIASEAILGQKQSHI